MDGEGENRKKTEEDSVNTKLQIILDTIKDRLELSQNQLNFQSTTTKDIINNFSSKDNTQQLEILKQNLKLSKFNIDDDVPTSAVEIRKFIEEPTSGGNKFKKTKKTKKNKKIKNKKTKKHKNKNTKKQKNKKNKKTQKQKTKNVKKR